MEQPLHACKSRDADCYTAPHLSKLAPWGVKMRRHQHWRLQAMAGVLALAFACNALAKPAVPSEAEQAAATKVIRDLFKADYLKTKPKDRLEFAQKLLAQVEKAGEDAVTHFVLLREARDAAAAAGNIHMTDEIIAQILEAFQATLDEARGRAYETLAASTTDPLDSEVLARSLSKAVDQAVNRGDLPSAIKLHRLVDQVARKARNPALVAQLTTKTRTLEILRKEQSKYELARVKLASDPKDAEANLQAGSYLAFFRNDFERGLPLLAVGKDEKLREAAALELKGPTQTEDFIKLGDEWYTRSLGIDASAKPHLQARALKWYKQALPSLSGLSRVKIEKRMDELEKAALEQVDNAAIWLAVREALRANQVQDKDGAGWGEGEKVREVPPEGALLIGFHYTDGFVGDKIPVLEFLQPIYLTAKGEKTGQAFGTPKYKPVIVKAKDGYAIGKVVTKAGSVCDGLGLVFMRIKGDHLDASDSYRVDIGGGGGNKVAIDGEGQPIVGVQGVATKSGRLVRPGFVVVTKASK